jgi:hypothetical protein
MQAYYRNTPAGMTVDHIVPLGHPLLAGLHVLANLQYLTPRKNFQRGCRIDYTHEEAEQIVSDGVAVWRTDVGEDGWIHWRPYL